MVRPRVLVRRVHLGLGLGLGALLALIAASGAVLVWRVELDPALHHVEVQPGETAAPLDRLVESARRLHPGFAPTALVLPPSRGRPAIVAMTTPQGEAVDVAVDPQTARALGSQWRERSPFHALRLLHAELYMGRAGRIGVGALGLALLAQGLSGLWLWWPFTRRGGLGLSIRWGRPWPALSHDLHRTVGALSLALSLPVALTGALLGLAAMLPAREEMPRGAVPGRPGQAPLSLDAIAGRVRAALPGARIVALELPDHDRHVVRARALQPGEPGPRGESLAWLDPGTGQILGVRDAREPGRWLWSLVTPLHAGELGGPAIRAVYTLGGLALPVLLVTGLLVRLARPRSPADRTGGARARRA